MKKVATNVMMSIERNGAKVLERCCKGDVYLLRSNGFCLSLFLSLSVYVFLY